MRTNKTITIQRLQPQVVGSNINVWANIITFEGFVQVVGMREFAERRIGAIGQSYVVYCVDVDVKEDDRLVIDTITHIIEGIEKYTASIHGINHTKILVYKE